jgi:hypothetical protein
VEVEGNIRASKSTLPGDASFVCVPARPSLALDYTSRPNHITPFIPSLARVTKPCRASGASTHVRFDHSISPTLLCVPVSSVSGFLLMTTFDEVSYFPEPIWCRGCLCSLRLTRCVTEPLILTHANLIHSLDSLNFTVLAPLASRPCDASTVKALSLGPWDYGPFFFLPAIFPENRDSGSRTLPYSYHS